MNGSDYSQVMFVRRFCALLIGGEVVSDGVRGWAEYSSRLTPEARKMLRDQYAAAWRYSRAGGVSEEEAIRQGVAAFRSDLAWLAHQEPELADPEDVARLVESLCRALDMGRGSRERAETQRETGVCVGESGIA